MDAENGNYFPSFIYGTAWKEDATTDLVEKAVSTGFTAIDTANQPRHYQEPLVGEALLRLAGKGITREYLFLQSKFTPVNGHDQRIPYDPCAKLSAQVMESFESTLKNLHTDFLDSYLLHGPYHQADLGNEDWEVWSTLEKIYETGRTRYIGISNVNAVQLELLTEKARIKPMIVQNRCFASLGWDRAVRNFCISNQIAYEGFSLLTANSFVLQNPKIQEIANGLGRTPAQVIFRFSMQAGMIPLTGTTCIQHMQEDLGAMNFLLKDDEVRLIESLTG